jgi:23S rRNA pseudouridine1911/1915/1917 synthase
MLHAASLAVDHPSSGARLSFEAPLPDDMAQLIRSLQRGEGAKDGRRSGKKRR